MFKNLRFWWPKTPFTRMRKAKIFINKKKKNSRIETDTCGRGLIQNTGKSTADWLVNSSVGWVPDFKTVGPDSILCQSNTQGLKMTKGVLPSLCL